MKKIFNSEIDDSFIGKRVELYGWVENIRDHGGVVFIDLKDRSGIIQCVCRKEKGILGEVSKISAEYVVYINGVVKERSKDTINPKIKTGNIEVDVDDIKILNESAPPPFNVYDRFKVKEELRLKYRYIDLRTPEAFEIFEFRSRVAQKIRNYLINNGFVEVETPFLTRSTPEGARDFLVPSRLKPHTFYALPQSPQLFKQLLMVAGFERYFQIVRCFRDEDLRADRQPEFTQLDLEMSFVDEEGVMNVVNGILIDIFSLIGVEIEEIPKISYMEAIKKFGSDKPDLRYSIEFEDVTSNFINTGFGVFKKIISESGRIMRVYIDSKLSRSQLDSVVDFSNKCGFGCVWVVSDGAKKNASVKHIETNLDSFNKIGTYFIVAGKEQEVYKNCGVLRDFLIKNMSLNRISNYSFLWITDFPLFEWDEEEKRWVSVHHPFTAPKELLDPSNTVARSYDIIINGVEVGGGSIRNHDYKIQKKIFDILNMSEEEQLKKFGFLLEALKYGAPPHGGIAIGFDRLIAIMLGFDSIREVIAFPKTQSGWCPLSDAPNTVDEKQLKELGIKLI
ncbi:MAG: aspartate--tRNA ligase [bacterium]|nr:aspartate--tRNA ligase [bacterium]